MAYHTIHDRASGKNVLSALQNIATGSIVVDYDDRKPTVDALIQDLKEGGVARNWNERERTLAIQALKTLGRSTEGCDSIFTEEGIRTLMYHSGLHKATEINIDKTCSREALKCLANALLLKPSTKPTFERLEGHSQCSVLLKRSQLSNESQFLFSRILFLMTIDASTVVRSLLDHYQAVNNVGVVLKTQMARSPDGTMFTQSMVLSEALKYLFNLMMWDPKIERPDEADFTPEQKTKVSGERFQSLLPTIISIIITIPTSQPNPLEPPHSHAIHVLLNFPISASALLVTRSQQATLLSVLLQILDDTLKHCLNTDDEASTEGMSNGTELDEIVPPLVIVLTNIASAGGEARKAMKARLLPDDVDRSRPLEKGDSFSARLIRRLTSARFPQIKETVGQLLFVVCNEDPSLLTRHVGYGNAAGFLMNRNLGVPASVSGIDSEDEEEDEDDEVVDMPSSSKKRSAVDVTPSPTSPLSPVTPMSTMSSTSTSTAATATKSPTLTISSSATRAAPATTSSSSAATGGTTIESAPLNRRMSSTSSTSVNPITGAYYPDPSAIRTAMADMTEEEKEEEAGRLLDLFDKLRRTGVMDVRNPALEAGLKQRERDRYYDERERKEQEEEEELERVYGKV
ncbi:MAG: guanine nucleotide exchange factor [Linnemannia gamsii]|nr:MAG: guanine nucleotide exchange factor [Linnemannia gamsii]